jgi:acyl dehydratase
MAIDPKHLGRTYGPYRYTVELEKITDFARAVSGGIPGRVFGTASDGKAFPWFVDQQAGASSPHGSIIAPPTFCVNFAMQPFAVACSDPEIGIDLVRLVHGEQEFTYHDVLRPGDVIDTTGEISSVKSRSSLDFLEVTTRSTRASDGKLVLEGVWTAIVRN